MSGKNRERAMAAGKTKFWCGCDMAKVGQFGKCRACGRAARPGKRKIPRPAYLNGVEP